MKHNLSFRVWSVKWLLSLSINSCVMVSGCTVPLIFRPFREVAKYYCYHCHISLSIRTEELGFHWTDFHEIWNFLFLNIHSFIHSFIHFAVCFKTSPKPLPKRALHIVRSRASSFKWKHPLLSLRSSSRFLRLLPRLPVTSIPPLYVKLFSKIQDLLQFVIKKGTSRGNLRTYIISRWIFLRMRIDSDKIVKEIHISCQYDFSYNSVLCNNVEKYGRRQTGDRREYKTAHGRFMLDN
jgi:hypothetical protein